jgi:hypothetical protein
VGVKASKEGGGYCLAMEEVPSIKILFSQTHSAKFVALSRDHRTLFWWIIKNYQINPACLCGIAPVLSWSPTSKQAQRSLFSHFGNIHNNYPGLASGATGRLGPLGVWGHWASGATGRLGPLGVWGHWASGASGQQIFRAYAKVHVRKILFSRVSSAHLACERY